MQKHTDTKCTVGSLNQNEVQIWIWSWSVKGSLLPSVCSLYAIGPIWCHRTVEMWIRKKVEGCVQIRLIRCKMCVGFSPGMRLGSMGEEVWKGSWTPPSLGAHRIISSIISSDSNLDLIVGHIQKDISHTPMHSFWFVKLQKICVSRHRKGIDTTSEMDQYKWWVY